MRFLYFKNLGEGRGFPAFLFKQIKKNDVENEEGIGLCRLPDFDAVDDFQQ